MVLDMSFDFYPETKITTQTRACKRCGKLREYKIDNEMRRIERLENQIFGEKD